MCLRNKCQGNDINLWNTTGQMTPSVQCQKISGHNFLVGVQVIALPAQSTLQQTLGISSANLAQSSCQWYDDHRRICANMGEMEEKSGEEF